MKRRVGRIVFGAAVALALLLPAPASAQTTIPGPCIDGDLPHGARSRICVPVVGWNGHLVVFAHGYVAVSQPIDFYHLTLGGVNLPLLVQSQGFAFATTTYRQNGLAILEGADDILALVAAFAAQRGLPQRTFIAGASEGGLVAALLLEQSPEVFSSGFAACGPVGSFRGQVNYVGDFRVLFDYFFPGVIPGTAVDVPEDVTENWFTVHLPEVLLALQSSPSRALELMRTSGAAYDPANPATIGQTAASVLTYNVVGSTDAESKLGGNPYDNRLRLYVGSSNGLRLNLRVQRFAASPVAVANMAKYETTGRLTRPLITLHTQGDETVPFWHEPLYLAKVLLTGHSGLLPLAVARYGHCNFTTGELLTAFALTVR
jgi:pimeloyl-ACP methyl ester carboxylesterase